jgi:hypothetical protein
MAGAALINDIEALLARIGFDSIRIEPKDGSQPIIREWAPEHDVADVLVSATIEAVKPAA